MDVIVERFQRRKIVSNPASPMLYYLRQKPKTCGTVDIDVLAASIQKNCAMTKGDVKHVIEALVEEIQGEPCQRRQGEAEPAGHFPHDVPLSRHGGLGQMYGAQYLEGEYPLYPRQGAEAGERQYRRHPQPGECGLCARQARGGRLRRRQSRRWFRRRLRRRRRPGRKSAGIKKE